PPVGVDRVGATAITTTPNGVTLHADDFASTTPATFDPADNNAPSSNSYLGVYITTLPFKGALTLNGNPVQAGAFIVKTDLDANRLVYTPNANETTSVPNYANFLFQVKDSGGTATFSAQDTDQTQRTISINLQVQHHAPAGANAGSNVSGTV